MDFLKNCQPLTKKSDEELSMILPKVIEIFIENSTEPEVQRESLKLLKISCTLGPSYQLQLAGNEMLMAKIQAANPIPNSFMQLLANICVQNPKAQQIVYQQFKPQIVLGLCEKDLSNSCAMIVHQMLINDKSYLNKTDLLEVLQNVLSLIENENELPDFVGLLLELMLTEHEDILEIYQQLETKIHFLHFVADFVKNHENPPVEKKLLKRLIMEFKRKSDNILKPDGTGAKTSPQEVYALLEIIAHGSCSPKYSQTLHEDSSLFLNLGCLLLAVQKLGKTSESIFAPVQKLDQIAPNSKDDTSIELDISYSLKSLVVKALGNLLYQNKKNQELVREMNILMAIMDCTNVDARNPLIKEYSILAIRNAVEGNLENQKIIASMTKIGEVQTPIMTEFTENVIRVKPNK